jgi:hypothetical protein
LQELLALRDTLQEELTKNAAAEGEKNDKNQI